MPPGAGAGAGPVVVFLIGPGAGGGALGTLGFTVYGAGFEGAGA